MIKINIEKLKQKKLEELKNYVARLLSSTDYIIIKIAEAQAMGDTAQVNALKQKYSTQLQQREAIRTWNEQIKRAIQNAQTLEELKAIEIRFEGV